MTLAGIKADRRAGSMAKPDTDDGYMKAAYELMAGLLGTPAVVGLRGVVLWEVFAQVYGWGKLEVATLSPKEIAGRRKVADVNVSRAIKELCFMGVLEKVSPQTYRFIKDHERYNFGETPEEKRDRTDYARDAARLAKSYKHHPDARPAAPKAANKAEANGTPALRVINSDNPALSQSITGDIGSDNSGTSDVITGASPPTPPYMEGKKKKQEAAGVPPEFSELCREADVIPALRDVAFGAKLRGAWGQDGDFAAWWSMIGVGVWREALATLAGKPAAQRHPRFYLGIVKSLHRQSPPPAAPRPEPKAEPLPESHTRIIRGARRNYDYLKNRGTEGR